MIDRPSPPTVRVKSALNRPAARGDVSLDIGQALDLLAEVVTERGHDCLSQPIQPAGGGHPDCESPDRLLQLVLERAGVDGHALQSLRDKTILDLHRCRTSPVMLTLGAALVLRAAQLTQDRGKSWGEALCAAHTAAVRYVELVPDHVFQSAVIGKRMTVRAAPSADQIID